MYRHLLVPTDGTELSTENITQAVDLARILGARITFFYARPDYASSLFAAGEMTRSVTPDYFAYAYEGRPREFLSKAEAAARVAGVDCDSVTAVSDTPYHAIVEAAREHGCDLICMASHGGRNALGMMLGSQTLKVLVLSPVPVLVSATQNLPAMNRAIATIQDEHRSLAAVLHALACLLREARDRETRLDVEAAKAVLHYVKVFPVALHHPREDAYLFHKLRRRTGEVDVQLDQLEAQHVEDQKRVALLETVLHQYEADVPGSLKAFEQAAGEYSRFIRAHFGMEEDVILPAARRHLTQEDWEEISLAFRDRNDPRFGGDLDSELRRLFSRIVNRAAPPPAASPDPADTA